MVNAPEGLIQAILRKVGGFYCRTWDYYKKG